MQLNRLNGLRLLPAKFIGISIDVCLSLYGGADPNHWVAFGHHIGIVVRSDYASVGRASAEEEEGENDGTSHKTVPVQALNWRSSSMARTSIACNGQISPLVIIGSPLFPERDPLR